MQFRDDIAPRCPKCGRPMLSRMMWHDDRQRLEYLCVMCERNAFENPWRTAPRTRGDDDDG